MLAREETVKCRKMCYFYLFHFWNTLLKFVAGIHLMFHVWNMKVQNVKRTIVTIVSKDKNWHQYLHLLVFKLPIVTLIIFIMSTLPSNQISHWYQWYFLNAGKATSVNTYATGKISVMRIHWIWNRWWTGCSTLLVYRE